jgi:hypothetical protein
MIRTEDDIRATLRDVARTAASADDVLHRLVTEELGRPGGPPFTVDHG